MFFQKTLAALALTTLAACGGGGGSSLFGPAEYAAFANDPNLIATTPNATVQALTNSATYNGYSNLIVGSGNEAVFYYGTMNVSANFATDTIGGSTSNFTRYGSAIASTANGTSVGGSIAFNGAISGDNESFDGAIVGTATGTIDGTPVAGDLTGTFTGVNAEGVTVSIDDNVNDIFGGGLALR